MGLFQNNYSSRYKIKVISVLCSLFIICCIYTISKNIPATPTPNFPQNITIKTKNNTLSSQNEKKPNGCMNNSVLRNLDPNHSRAHLEFWRHLPDHTVMVYRKKWQNFMTGINSFPAMQGQGILFVAGNRDTFQRTITSIKLLRKFGSKLNIEVWHLSDEQPSPEIRDELLGLGAKPKDLSDPNLVRPIASRRNADKQFQIKAAAIINSSFKEVLYLDSDNIPTRDPAFLFETEQYKSTGALFWPDFWKTHGENKIFDILDIGCVDEWEQESGQMVIDKERSWLPLQLAWYMQKHYDIYFQFLNGDKDTFKYAWKALNIPFTMIETLVGMAGTIENDRFCGHTMLQYSPNNEDEQQILFVHANLLKITDKTHFIHPPQPEHPWDFAKYSTMSDGNTWIKPEFYVNGQGQACMDFSQKQGEPEVLTEDFDRLLPSFQKDYFDFGGIGGETRRV